MEPGDDIKRLRERAGLALSDLAAQTGLFLKHLHAIESGRVLDKRSFHIRLAR